MRSVYARAAIVIVVAITITITITITIASVLPAVVVQVTSRVVAIRVEFSIFVSAALARQVARGPTSASALLVPRAPPSTSDFGKGRWRKCALQ
jgi:hypothetical protein